MTNHPRPQLTRPRLHTLDGTWQFEFDDADVGLREGWVQRDLDGEIQVPFPPESPASGIGDPSPHPVLWYRRSFQVPVDWGQHERVLLHFGAVDYRATVWVNGHQVATHEGGHTPFSADITEALTGGSAEGHVVVVRAEDLLEPDQPRGKQYWHDEPRAIWYSRTSGIWQPVWLEPVPVARIASVRWTPDVPTASAGVEVEVLGGAGRELRVGVRLTLRGEQLADDTWALHGSQVARTITLAAQGTLVGRENEFHWTPEHPNLVDATVVLLEGDTVVDEVGSYFGMRSVRVAENRFLLNDLPYYCRLVLTQGFWPESHLACPNDDAFRREVELVKELGFNGVRMHQKLEDPRFLAWCDRIGLLVWAEMPSAFSFSRRAVRRLTQEWTEVLQRDYNHPSIVLWLPFNESWGVSDVATDPQQQQYVRAIYHLTRTYDGTRPVVGNDGWENVVSDVWGVHDYSLDPAVLTERYGSVEAVDRTIREVQPGHRSLRAAGAQRLGEPVMLTEFGGISFAPAPGEKWFGYGVVRDEDAFVDVYQRLVGAVLAAHGISGFCYTQLADVEQETNGVLTADREHKVLPARLRQANQRISAAIPGDAITQAIATGSEVGMDARESGPVRSQRL